MSQKRDHMGRLVATLRFAKLMQIGPLVLSKFQVFLEKKRFRISYQRWTIIQSSEYCLTSTGLMLLAIVGECVRRNDIEVLMSLNQRLNRVVNLQWTKPKDRAESFLIDEVLKYGKSKTF